MLHNTETIVKPCCVCGICSHFSESECMLQECHCCENFHVRSGKNVSLSFLNLFIKNR